MKTYSGSSLIITLVMLSSVLLFIFINKDDLIKQNRLTQHYYYQYLENKLELINQLDQEKLNELCKQQKNEMGKVGLNKLNYYFSCYSLFVDIKKNSRKYIFLIA